MRHAIASKGAPEAVGNYSQAVKAGNLLFLSGQICVNPATGKMERESITAQTTRIMENIKAIVEEAGASMDDVVRCRAFLANMDQFPEFDAVYGKYFTKPYPARMTVACAGIYDNLDVEMDAIVLLP
jgi:2-iminobutanoate/2-iminopropanoate deaminase